MGYMFGVRHALKVNECGASGMQVGVGGGKVYVNKWCFLGVRFLESSFGGVTEAHCLRPHPQAPRGSSRLG